MLRLAEQEAGQNMVLVHIIKQTIKPKMSELQNSRALYGDTFSYI